MNIREGCSHRVLSPIMDMGPRDRVSFALHRMLSKSLRRELPLAMSCLCCSKKDLSTLRWVMENLSDVCRCIIKKKSGQSVYFSSKKTDSLVSSLFDIVKHDAVGRHRWAAILRVCQQWQKRTVCCSAQLEQVCLVLVFSSLHCTGIARHQ